MNEQQAKLLLPLVNNPQAWAALEEYLKELVVLHRTRLVVEESESEMRRLQGKLVLLETLVVLKKSVNDTVEVNKKK
tara:strand:- start:246 stop:476 length:231 start_codon:yes stop_codon:yes gene_type:complete